MVILFVFGAIVGSFLNVVALRWDLPAGRQVLGNFGGRSACQTCGKTLRWFELVPIFSFFIQKGKCRNCGAKISFQYLIIEIWTGLIFLSIFNLQFLIYKEFSPSFIVHSLLLVVVFCLYIIITIYDLRHKIIPDALVYAAIVLSLIVPLFIVHYSFLDWLAGPILFSFFGSIWLLSRGRAMGFGDAKLALSIGFLLGAALGFSAIILAFWIGAVFGLVYLLISRASPLLRGAKKITMKTEIPFAPFMVIATWLSLIWNLDLWHVSLF